MFTTTGSSSCSLSAGSPRVNWSPLHCRYPHPKSAVVAVVAAVVGLNLITKKEPQDAPEAHVPFVLLVFLLPWFLVFQPNLAGKRPIPGLRRNLVTSIGLS